MCSFKPSDFTWDKEPYADVYVYGEVLAPNGRDQGLNTLTLDCFKGTSMATPAAAGLACLAIQRINDSCQDLPIAKDPISFRKKRKEAIMNAFQQYKGERRYEITSVKDNFMSLIDKEVEKFKP